VKKYEDIYVCIEAVGRKGVVMLPFFAVKKV